MTNSILQKAVPAALAGAAFAASTLPATAGGHLSEITVGYFLEWPMPFQYAKVNGTYEDEMGVDINWVAFDTGTAMSAAMASGDVQLSVSQGVPPFVVATSAGQDLQIVDVAVSYAENDNCVVSDALGIDKTNATELEGKRVAVPIGTAAHYGFLKQMEHFGVDITTMEIVDMPPAEGQTAFAQGNLDMVCGWGGALRRMKEDGNVLLTGAEKEELGILVFDVTSGPAAFVAENPDLVSAFLKVTADANEMWNSGEHTEEMLPVIAEDAGMSEEDTLATMQTFVFPGVDEQLSEKWLGGGAQDFMLGVASVFQEAGSIPATRDSYEGAVNTGPLAAVGG